MEMREDADVSHRNGLGEGSKLGIWEKKQDIQFKRT